MTKYWAIVCVNLESDDDTFYFENYEIAKKNFDILCVKNKDKEKFEMTNENTASWFDSNYNEYSTYINLIKIKLPTIYNEIIF